MVVRVYHDFTCPWCWIGLFQAIRLREEFGVEIEWRGAEMWPEDLDWPESSPAPAVVSARPPTPSRLDLAYAAQGLTPPTAKRPSRMRTFRAHQAVAFARRERVEHAMVEALYRALWERGEEINALDVILRAAQGVVSDVDGLRRFIEANEGRDETVKFDDPAYAAGIFNVPTFEIGDRRLAEQPYSALAAAVGAEPKPYSWLRFPHSRADRPYVFVNMVATIDGKTISGEREESVSDLGSSLDHELMNRTIAAADAVLIGGATLRASGPRWNPNCRTRVVVTRSGAVDLESNYLRNGGLIVAPEDADFDAGAVKTLRCGRGGVDWSKALTELRARGIERLLVLGGSEVNAELLALDLVDELFLTVAPKIKLGRATPTYAGGDPLPRASILDFELVESHVVAGETFLRYRRRAPR